MGQFNYATNRIMNGICEWCGIKASECEHYKNGQSKPLDYADKLIDPLYVPVYKHAMVEPLKESEKVATMAEAKEKMDGYIAKGNALEGEEI